MSTYKNRRAPGGWIGGVDWQDIRACCARASGGLAWLTFVAVMLAMALGRAP